MRFEMRGVDHQNPLSFGIVFRHCLSALAFGIGLCQFFKDTFKYPVL
jgi:hypothetical protein